MGAAKKVIIVKVGVEGGSLTLWGRKQAGRWSFASETSWSFDDDAPSEPPAPLRWVRSWAEALAALDQHPWATFYADEVHPEFREPVREAVEARLAAAPESSRENARPRWDTVLEPASPP